MAVAPRLKNVAGALAGALLLSLAAAPTTVIVQPRLQPAAAPQALADDLTALDKKIDRTIIAVKEDGLKGDDLADAVGKLRDDYRAVLVTYMPKMWGLPFYDVFIGFQSVDVYVRNARGWVSRGNDEKAGRSLNHAKRELADLLDELTGAKAADVPPALVSGLKQLKDDLTAAARHASDGSLTGEQCGDLIGQKLHLIKATTKEIFVFGQRYYTLFLVLEDLESDLESAEFGYPFGTEESKKRALEDLRQARAAKENFYAAMVRPPIEPMTARFVPDGGAQPCETPNAGETCYGVNAKEVLHYQFSYFWRLLPPLQDPNCGVLFHGLGDAGSAEKAVWHHADQNGCNHAVEGPDGHEGVVVVNVSNFYWQCIVTHLGTETTAVGSGPPATCLAGSRIPLTVTKAGLGGTPGTGTVSSAPAGIDCGPSCATASAGFDEKQQVTLTATAADGSTFAGWTGAGCTGTGTCTVTLGDRSQAVMATFQHS